MNTLKLFYEEINDSLLCEIRKVLENKGKITITLEHIRLYNRHNSISIGNYKYNKNNYSLQYENEAPVYFTILENQVFQLLLENVNNVVPRELILSSFWPHVSYYSSRSLDIIIHKLRKKIEKDNQITITTLKGVGFSLKLLNDADNDF